MARGEFQGMLSVLLIEDNQGDVRLIREMIKERETVSLFALEYVSTLEDGLDAIDNGHFDIILLDLGLPDSQGLDTLRTLRAKAPKSPIVIITGLADEIAGISSLEVGADDFLNKRELNASYLTHAILYAIQRKALTEKLKVSDASVESANSGLIVTGPRWKIQHANLSASRNLGYDQKELHNQLLTKFSKDESKLAAGLRSIMESSNWSGEIEMIRKGGGSLLAQVSATAVKDDFGKVSSIIVSFSDISALRAIEHNLRATEKKYQHLFTIAMEGFWVIDSSAKTILANPRMAEMLGYTSDEMAGRSLSEFMDGESKELLDILLRPRMSGMSENHEFTFVKKDGSTLYALLHATPIMDPDGSYSGALACVSDISDRKRYEFELKERTEEAEKQRQRARTYFDLLAHDIANLIAPIQLYCDLTRLEKNHSSETLLRAKRLSDQSKRASSLIINLRMLEELERIGPGNVESVDLIEVITDVNAKARSEYWSKSVSLKIDGHDGKSVHVKGGIWTKHVISEIINNSVKHSDSNAVNIRISISEVDCGSGIEGWQIDFSDDGPGIPNDMKDLLFSTFDPMRRFKRGVATNMSFCSSFVKHFGGEIIIGDRIESHPEKGAKITLRLPKGE